MKFLDLLMDVVVKAVVNLLACHLYQNGGDCFSFLLYHFSFSCTAKLMLEMGPLFAQVVRW
jgi:hypothetical protein